MSMKSIPQIRNNLVEIETNDAFDLFGLTVVGTGGASVSDHANTFAIHGRYS